MCHGRVLVYTCHHRQVAEIQMCARARQPANHHGAWPSFVFWLTGKPPRRPCGTTTTAERRFMNAPCAACSAARPPRPPQPHPRAPAPPPHAGDNTHTRWDQAFIPTRAAPPPPPLQGLPARPQRTIPPPQGLPARPQRTTAPPSRTPGAPWQPGPSASAPLSFAQHMAVRQQQQRQRRPQQTSCPTRPTPPPRGRYSYMAAAAAAAVPPPRPPPPTPTVPPRADRPLPPPPSPSQTRVEARTLRQNLPSAHRKKGPAQSRRLAHSLFCLRRAPSSEESLVCIDASRIEREGARR